ncbi:hypothetical protein BJ912DRAFT_983341 [Pholiota molesta]|nr:hypothetical protein BJ912DRAFT_983341 [Pholiota molesta]
MSIFGITVDLNPSYGAYLIGTFISNILLGITCLQTYMYFRTYKDNLLIKMMVSTLLYTLFPLDVLCGHSLIFDIELWSFCTAP